MSAITSISNHGFGFCHIHIKETINAQKYLAFFEDLLILHGDQECCFFLDNAAVHRKEDVIEAAARRNQAVLLNAPYSSEMNPIENFFGVWKGKIMDKITSVKTTEDFKNLVRDSFLSMSAGLFQRTIRHMVVDVQTDVLARKDI